jgi:hypothetical protein
MNPNKKEPFDTTSSLLQSLEELGSLSDAFGLYEMKPFRDWNGSSWKNRIFSMRLCNAGEVLDISALCNDFPETARTQVTKIELIIRSVWQIDGRELVTAEELEEYNKKHKTEISALEHCRLWATNLEQIVVDRLDAIIGGLTLKQIRMLQGIQLCDHCGTTFSKVPEGSKKLRFSMGEIICNECLPKVDQTVYDFDTRTQKPTAPVLSDEVLTSPSAEDTSFGTGSPHKCACGEEYDTLETFIAHRTNCPKATEAVPH